MGLVAVAAAKGSPGVTTLALAMGALWPRQAMVAECDAAGADIPVRMQSVDGGVLDPDRGLLSLAAAGRKGLHSDLVLGHTQRVVGGLEVLVGARVPEQAAGMSSMWPLLGPAFDGIAGYDVIADCGRVGATTPQTALLRAAHLLVMVGTTEPSSVVHLRERLLALAPVLDPTSPMGTPIAVALVAPPKAHTAVDQVKDALGRTEVPLRDVWHIAHDPKGAGFFKGQVAGRADKTLLVKTATVAAERAAAAVEPFFDPLPEPAPVDETGPNAEWSGFSFTSEPTADGHGQPGQPPPGAPAPPPTSVPPNQQMPPGASQ
ncbi:MAG: hypothetical protein ACRDQA_32290 [Nocardioidaceae bacterium]